MRKIILATAAMLMASAPQAQATDYYEEVVSWCKEMYPNDVSDYLYCHRSNTEALTQLDVFLAQHRMSLGEPDTTSPVGQTVENCLHTMRNFPGLMTTTRSCIEDELGVKIDK